MDSVIKNKSGDCNFLFIISAPSGTGKTTICKRLLQQNKDLCVSISATTRAPRQGEVDGKDYFFITKEEYLAKVNTGGFLENACVFDNYYGTPLDFVHNKISVGMNIIFDIDWQGMRKIKSVDRFNVSTLFLVPSISTNLILFFLVLNFLAKFLNKDENLLLNDEKGE